VYRKPNPKRSGHEVRQVAFNRLYPDVLMMQPSQYRNGDIGAIAEPIDARAHPAVKAGAYAIERLTLMSALLPKADMKPGHEAPSLSAGAAMAIIHPNATSLQLGCFNLRLGDHLDQDARNAGWSDPSSTENSTGIISLVVTLPFRSFSATTSC
jgi:hypothetical protein